MNPLLARLSFVLAIVAQPVLGANPSVSLERKPGPSAAPATKAVDLVVHPEWYWGSYGAEIGSSGMAVQDLDGDGRAEVVASARTNAYGSGEPYWYVVSWDGHAYRQSGIVTEEWRIESLRVADLDGDEEPEILAAVGRAFRVYDGRSLELTREIPYPEEAYEAASLCVADVDRDGALEFVFTDSYDLWIVAAADGALEQRLPGRGSYTIAVGNVDDDAELEIVGTGPGVGPGYVLNGRTREAEWEIDTGFGYRLKVGDVDGDGRDEIVCTGGWDRITVYDAERRAPGYEILTHNDIADLVLADTDRDGRPEIVYGDGQFGGTHGHDGVAGALVWTVDNPSYGITAIGAGDTDGDGTVEVLWSTGWVYAVPEALLVADPFREVVEWTSEAIAPPLYGLDHGDVDADGAPELVIQGHRSPNGYAGGAWSVYDARTKRREYVSADASSSEGTYRVRVAQLDSDAQLEIVSTGNPAHGHALVAFDGVTHAAQWTSALPDSLNPVSVAAADLDADGDLEVVAGTGRVNTGAPGPALYLFDGSTGTEQWRSVQLGDFWASLFLLRVAQLDGDAALEIVASDRSRIWIFDGATREQQLMTPPLGVRSLDVTDLDDDGELDLVFGDASGAIRELDPASGAVLRTLGSYGEAIEGLRAVDVTADGRPDFVFGQGRELVVVDGGTPSVTAWRSGRIGTDVGRFDSLVVADVDDDGSLEILANLGEVGAALFEIPEAQNHAPVANAGADQTVECDGARSATVVLDGTASTDVDVPDGGGTDIASWEWTEAGRPLASGALVPVLVPLGIHDVTLSVTDRAGASDRDRVRIGVVDTLPPEGAIVSPAPRGCYGPAALPVEIRDDFTDRCEGDVLRVYGPPGAIVEGHGDWAVALTALDSGGRPASTEVRFTIDRFAPAVSILSPTDGTWLLPEDLSLPLQFESDDDDGAAGGVVHDAVLLRQRPGGRACTVWDGATFGDRDGRLDDEILVLDLAETCRLAALCGFDHLEHPSLDVVSRDCGQNVGVDRRSFRGRLDLRPGLCDPQPGSSAPSAGPGGTIAPLPGAAGGATAGPTPAGAPQRRARAGLKERR